MTLPHPYDSDDAFDGQLVPLVADDRVVDRWARAVEHANRNRPRPLRLTSPLDELPETLRVRQLPVMPWPVQWENLGRRCRTHPGDVIGVVGDTGSGKTQFAIQHGRSFTALSRGCVLWWAGELTPVDINLRIIANAAGRHMMEIRDLWQEGQLQSALATVTDRWRYVPRPRGVEAILNDMHEAIEIAKSIYQAPPLLVIDYVQKMTMGAPDKRAALIDACEGVREMTASLGCYTLMLSQSSRGNRPMLAGRAEVKTSAETAGAGAESSEIENAAANMITLGVFKADDAPELDAHWHVGKARHTGLEGPVGARYTKQGGVWTELDHLPATPLEIEAEVKKSGKRGDGPPRAAREVRETLNGTRSIEAANKRREVIVAALRAAGVAGLGVRDLRRAKGTGSAARLNETLAELEAAGRVRRAGGKLVLVA